MGWDECLDKLVVLGIKNYIDKREKVIKKLPYCGQTYISFEKGDINETIDKEFNKFKRDKQGRLLLLYVKTRHDGTIILSAYDEAELRKNFIDFLVAY